MKIHNKPNVKLNDGEYIAIRRAYTDVQRDDYENGCDGYGHGWSCDCDQKFESIEDALQWLIDYNCFNYNEWEFDGETFQTGETLNAENRVANEDEIAQWKRGEIDLYYAVLVTKLVIVSEREI